MKNSIDWVVLITALVVMLGVFIYVKTGNPVIEMWNVLGESW